MLWMRHTHECLGDTAEAGALRHADLERRSLWQIVLWISPWAATQEAASGCPPASAAS